jgi:hypothetical protein
MKTMKIALLGTAALAAVSVSARADELSDLKAQIEALNARVAQVETAPSVPAGYQLMTISEGKATKIPGLESDRQMGDTATIIGIMPTADAPAETSIEFSGLVRAALVWDDYQAFSPRGGFTPGIDLNDDGDRNDAVDLNADGDTDDEGEEETDDKFADDDFSIRTRGQLKVTGKTQTAIGEVGATITFRANEVGFGDPSVISNEQYGYWNITDELTLGGGYTGSLSGIGYGYDGKCNCYYTDNAAAGYGHGDTTQMRLSYNSGPMGFAIALEDDESGGSDNDDIGVAAELKYSGDTISGEISGGWWESDDAWVALGLGFGLDMFNVSVSAGFGESDDADFWKANILASVNMTDAVHAEIGFNHFEGSDGLADQSAVLAGIYYDPVSQLTLGMEGEYISNEGPSNNDLRVDFVTVYRF